MIVSGWGLNFIFGKACGFGCGVGIKSGTLDLAASGPEAGAAHFVRVGFASNGVGAGTLGRRASGKSSHGKIETAPEKMDGADFPDESGAKFFQHLIDQGQDPPELMN